MKINDSDDYKEAINLHNDVISVILALVWVLIVFYRKPGVMGFWNEAREFWSKMLLSW